MPVTKDEAQMLATLAVACRPHGAPRWDHAGVMAALAKVSTLMLADVMAAVARAASDRTAETPAVIAATNSLHWSERVGERSPNLAPKRHEQCRDCGRHVNTCLCESGPTPYGSPPTTADPRRGADLVRAAMGGAS